jgi:NAD(P)H-dependent FMN reductase
MPANVPGVTVVLRHRGQPAARSYNAALLRALRELAPASVTFEEASIRGIPVYDGDVEAESGSRSRCAR